MKPQNERLVAALITRALGVKDISQTRLLHVFANSILAVKPKSD